jgi:type IV pilus assembly protein PilX
MNPVSRTPSPHPQRGATLIITLVMLVLITLISVSTMRTATMDEKMAGTARDRDKAFQAAEAAVQQCLTQLKNDTYTGTPLTPAASTTATQNWEVAANWSNANSTEMTVDTTGLAAQPRCMFEALGAGTGNYRITGRAVGASSQTEVILQATYSTD